MLDVDLADGFKVEYEEEEFSMSRDFVAWAIGLMVFSFLRQEDKEMSSLEYGLRWYSIVDVIYLKCRLDCRKEINLMSGVLWRDCEWTDKIGAINIRMTFKVMSPLFIYF